MICYREIKLSDRDWMRERLRQSGFPGSEYCFTNQFLWGGISSMRIAEVEGMLCTVYPARNGKRIHDFPVGSGDPAKVIKTLAADDGERGGQTVIRGILEEKKSWMEEAFPGLFEFEESRKEWDYLYPVEKLSKLAGQKYHGKRNHIARFQSGGDWSYESMRAENIPECRAMYEEWLAQNRERLDDSLEQERYVVEGSFRWFKELELQGGVLRQQGRVVAFCIGEPLTEDTYIVHVEKAYPQIPGAYPMINWQFVQHGMEGFTFVNREDDLGLEGLRRAKLSYRPDPLLKKYTAGMMR